jgi:hypothetical protein
MGIILRVGRFETGVGRLMQRNFENGVGMRFCCNTNLGTVKKISWS